MKGWLIGFLLVVGGFYLWLGEKKSSQPEKSASLPNTPTYTVRSQSPPLQSEPNRQASQRKGAVYQAQVGSRDESSDTALQPATRARLGYNQQRIYSFRPLQKKTNRAPDNLSSYAYPNNPANQGHAGVPVISSYQDANSSYALQPTVGAQYSFRQPDPNKRSKRWTGNYQPIQRNWPLTNTIQSESSQAQSVYGSPWRLSVTTEHENPR